MTTLSRWERDGTLGDSPYDGARKYHLINLSAVLAFLTATALIVGCGGSGPSEVEMTASANRIRTPANWNLGEESVHGPSRGCMDVDCPSLHRIWYSAEPPTSEELVALTEAAGWESDPIDGTCQPKPNRTGQVRLCQLSGRTDRSWPFEFSVSGPMGDRYMIGLKIVP